MEDTYSIRFISPEQDAASCLKVYEPYVFHTPITFDYKVPELNEFQSKILDTIYEYPWLVCLKNDQIEGYAYASRHRYKTAYQWSAESTIYITESLQGKGIGSILYETLLSILKIQGFFNVYAGVTVPNKKSELLHSKMGFEEIGIFNKIGFKSGAWHDVKWFQKTLQEYIINPPLPFKFEELKHSIDFQTILSVANNKLMKT